MRLPIGIQSFEELRSEGYVYVDKTEMIYSLVNNYKTVFLGRPRAFGKSLLLSTIHEYLAGEDRLFEGLAISQLESRWAKYPVVHLDFTIGNYCTVQGLLNLLEDQLYPYEERYFVLNHIGMAPHLRLKKLIETISNISSYPPVVLIEDYDKPLLRCLKNPQLEEAFSDILRPFYGVLKSEGHRLRFVMLTGKSRYSKFSVLGDLDNIEDISLNPQFAEICGFTQEEIINTFGEQIKAFAEKDQISSEEIIRNLIDHYGGYRFSEANTVVCDPNSVLRSLKDQKFYDYWYESSTPSFLKIFLAEHRCPISKISSAEPFEESLYQVDPLEAIPLLYQTGYLTIKEFDSNLRKCKLGFPNIEVNDSYIHTILPFSESDHTPKSRRFLVE